jgi:hypothetical protein
VVGRDGRRCGRLPVGGAVVKDFATLLKEYHLAVCANEHATGPNTEATDAAMVRVIRAERAVLNHVAQLERQANGTASDWDIGIPG